MSNLKHSFKVPIIQVRGLSKSFGSRCILDNINFDVYEGESFVIIGPSGTGKSVLIKCILGLLKPDSGEIFIRGYNLQKISFHQRRELYRECSMLFQGGALFDSLDVLNNIAFGPIYSQKMSPSKAYEIALSTLKDVDLSPDIASFFPKELSGGMQKRVALARAIATSPRFIFFDEPTTGLDPVTSTLINDLILKCTRQIGATALTITHDIASVRKVADRVGFLVNGQFVWFGSVDSMNTTLHPYVHQFIHGLTQGPLKRTDSRGL